MKHVFRTMEGEKAIIAKGINMIEFMTWLLRVGKRAILGYRLQNRVIIFFVRYVI